MKYYLKLCMQYGLVLSAFSTLAQTSKLERLQEIKREKYRTPVPAINLLQENASSSTTKKVRAGEKKISPVTVVNVEEGEAQIAINPANPNQLIMSYMENSTSGLRFPIYFSNDGGVTWSKSTFNPASYLTQDIGAGTMAAGGGDPVFAYDKTGKLHYSWIYLALNPAIQDTAYALMYHAVSSDNGQTFTLNAGDDHFIGKSKLDLVTFESYANADGFYDRQWFAMDLSNTATANTLYCSFVYFPNQAEPTNLEGITIKKKLFSSNTFGATKYQVFDGSSQFGNVVVDANGKLHVSFCDLNLNKVLHKSSTDGGITWSAAHDVYTGNNLFGSQGGGFLHDRENAALNMVADGANNLHMTWSDMDGSNYNSYYSRSTDGGITWSTPTILLINSNKTLMPVVAASGNQITIGMYGVDASKVADYYIINSTNNGLSFGTPIKISQQSSNFASTGTRWYGDYFNAVRTDQKIYNIWSDGRSGSTKMYVSVTDAAPNGLQEITSINSNFQVSSIAPNPIVADMNVEINCLTQDKITIQILSTEGKILYRDTQLQSAGKHTIRVNMQLYPKGLYHVRISNAAGDYVTRNCIKQ